jgi:hypothetical protein
MGSTVVTVKAPSPSAENARIVRTDPNTEGSHSDAARRSSAVCRCTGSRPQRSGTRQRSNRTDATRRLGRAAQLARRDAQLHDDHVYVEGEVRQAAPFAEHLVLRRSIRASLVNRWLPLTT